jgi:hypothetical protein
MIKARAAMRNISWRISATRVGTRPGTIFAATAAAFRLF